MFSFCLGNKIIEKTDAHAVSVSPFLSSRFSRNNPNCGGFSLVELLIVVAIVGVLGVISFVAIQRTKTRALNERMLDDLVAVANALEDFRRDHQGAFPEPTTSTSQNVLCFYADATYADCADGDVAFRQGMIDNDLLTKRYLREVPTDPRTGSRYVYGVSKDKKFYQVAGIWENDNGSFEARTVENLAKGFELPSLVRAYDGPNFVVDREANLPYPSDRLTLTGTLENINGTVWVDGSNENVTNGLVVRMGNTIKTIGPGSSVDIYLSDGSVTSLATEAGVESEVTLKSLSVEKNDKTGTVTKILLRLKLGKIWNKVARLAAASEFRVETTGAIAGVRGTEFGVGTDGTVKVRRGRVYKKMLTNVSGLPNDKESAEYSEALLSTRIDDVPEEALATPADQDYLKDLDTNYGRIPLTRNNRPHILSIRPNAIDGSKVDVTVRNVNFFANRVSRAMEARLLPQVVSITRTVRATRLAVYDAATNELIPLLTDQNINIGGQQTGPYTITLDPTQVGSLAMRFELTDPLATSKVLRSSSLSPIPVPQAGQEMDEKAIYPNLVPLDTGFSLVAPDRVPTGGTFNVAIAACAPEITYSLSTSGACTLSPTSWKCPTPPTTPSLITATASSAIGTCNLGVTATLSDGKIVTDTKAIQVVAPTAQLSVENPVVRWVSTGIPHWEVSVRWSKGNSTGPNPNLVVAPVDGAPTFPCPVPNAPITVNPVVLACPGLVSGSADAAYAATFSLGNEPPATRQFTIPSATNTVTAEFTIRKGGETLLGNSVAFDATSDVSLDLAAPPPVDTSKYAYVWTGAAPVSNYPDRSTLEVLLPSTPGQAVTKTVTLAIRKKVASGIGDLVSSFTKTVTVRRTPVITAIRIDASPSTVRREGSISLAVHASGLDGGGWPTSLTPPPVPCDFGTLPTGISLTNNTLSASSAALFGSPTLTCSVPPAGPAPTGYALGTSLSANTTVQVQGCGDGKRNGGEMCDGTDACAAPATCSTDCLSCVTSTPTITGIAFEAIPFPGSVEHGDRVQLYINTTPPGTPIPASLCTSLSSNVDQTFGTFTAPSTGTTATVSCTVASGTTLNGQATISNFVAAPLAIALAPAPAFAFTVGGDTTTANANPVYKQISGIDTVTYALAANPADTAKYVYAWSVSGDGSVAPTAGPTASLAFNGLTASGTSKSGAITLTVKNKTTNVQVGSMAKTVNVTRIEEITNIAFGSSANPRAPLGGTANWASADLGGNLSATAGGETVTFSPDQCAFLAANPVRTLTKTVTPSFSLAYGAPTSGTDSLKCKIPAGTTIQGHPVPTDVWTAPLPISLCGNAAKETGEACDDGNSSPNDGCGSTCGTESGYTCYPSDPFFPNGISICERSLLVQCVGQDVASNTSRSTVTGGLKNTAMGTYYQTSDSSCWALGVGGQSCDTACVGIGLGCAAGDWNDGTSCQACKALTGFTICSFYNQTGASAAPFSATLYGTAHVCRYRSGVALSCGEPSPTGIPDMTDVNRVCRCG